MKKMITMGLIIIMVSLVGCGYKEVGERIPMCLNPSILDCKQVSECLDDCKNEPMITWAQDCRGEFQAYVIAKCGQ